MLGTVISRVVLRRLEVAPSGGSLEAARIDRGEIMADAAVSRLEQQLLDDPFRLFVTALAELVMANAPLRIDDIERRPILVIQCVPDREIIVDRDGIRGSHLGGRSAHVV